LVQSKGHGHGQPIPVWAFRLFGFPVRAEPFFFVVALFIGAPGRTLDTAAIWVVAVFLSVVAHELGHAFAGRRYGLSPEIRLHAMGGLTSWNTRRPLTPRQNLMVTLSGPLAGFAVWGLVTLIAPVLFADPSPRTQQVISDLLFVNLYWGLFNLLPILPLDGGQATRSLVHLFRGQPDELLPLQISIFAGVPIVLWLLGQRSLPTAALVGYMVYNNFVALRAQMGAGGRRSR
jgi:stage IV sporulation protein FB